MSTTVFVMAHKAYSEPDDPTYRTVFVGAKGKPDIMPGCLRDDAGEDNISDLNPYFSELTGIYWVWKNYTGQENIGVCHYRRYFSDDSLEKLTSAQYDEILEKYDLITSKNIPTEISYRDSFARAHNAADLDAVGDTIQRVYPEYREAFDEVMAGHDQYFGNLFVMPRRLFDEYCEWMFTILTETMPAIDMTGYNAYQQRVYGFLTENLPLVYIKARGLRNYESQVVYTSEKAETTEVVLAITELLHQKKTHEAKEMLTQILKVRPEVALITSDLSGNIEFTKQILFIKDHDESEGKDNFFTREYDLTALMNFYKEAFIALSHLSRREDVEESEREYLKDNGFDLFAANVILSNDPSERFGRESLDRNTVMQRINEVCVREV